jgi:RNA polymerase sigma factor (sigma-70 family)
MGEVREEDIIENWPMVQRIAAMMASKMGKYWSTEELASFGYDGLYDALSKYDASKGAWVAYATIRIRGSILDGCSLKSWHHLCTVSPEVFDDIGRNDREANLDIQDEATSILSIFSPRIRAFLQLRYIKGYDLAKIGSMWGVTPSAVSKAIKRALVTLRCNK